MAAIPRSPLTPTATLSRCRPRRRRCWLHATFHQPLGDQRRPERVDEGRHRPNVIGQLFALVAQALSPGLGDRRPGSDGACVIDQEDTATSWRREADLTVRQLRDCAIRNYLM